MSLKGYDLKDAIQELYGVNRIRIYLPASLDNGNRYDFALCLPEQERPEKMRNRVRQGIEDYFHIAASRESRLVDTYIVTTTDRQPPRSKAQSHDEIGFSSASSIGFETVGGLDDYPADLKPVSIHRVRSVRIDGTVDDFCRTLEMMLDRPVVNETNLQGEFEFDVEGNAGARNDFLERLRDQTGLLITAAQRNVRSTCGPASLRFAPHDLGLGDYHDSLALRWIGHFVDCRLYEASRGHGSPRRRRRLRPQAVTFSGL